MTHRNKVKSLSIEENLRDNLTAAICGTGTDVLHRFSRSTRAPHVVKDTDAADQTRTFTVNIPKGPQPALCGNVTVSDDVSLGIEIYGYRNPDYTLSLTGIISDEDDRPFDIIGRGFGDFFELTAIKQLRVAGLIGATMTDGFTASCKSIGESGSMMSTNRTLDLALFAVMNKAVSDGEHRTYTLTPA